MRGVNLAKLAHTIFAHASYGTNHQPLRIMDYLRIYGGTILIAQSERTLLYEIII
jgi:hypothetical protein